MFFDTRFGLLLVRVSGKRSLSKFYAFDLVITVVLGSILSPLILSESVAFFQGVLALALLISLLRTNHPQDKRDAWRQAVRGLPVRHA